MMRCLQALVVLAAAASATLNLKALRPDAVAAAENARRVARQSAGGDGPVFDKRQQPKAPKFLTEKTRAFRVNGSTLPNVDFDVGESYAGLLPIAAAGNGAAPPPGGNATGDKLYFWFFPSESQQADKEILIWLTGGPGCSSTGELLSENGPMLWQPGTFKPIRNKWSWHRVTNVVWVDQPVGAGFSQGATPSVRDENDVARQFLGFWRNFVDTFGMKGYKVYVTGSSYSGMYCPYIAAAMLDANGTAEGTGYFDVKGMQVFDGVYSLDAVSVQIPMPTFVDRWSRVFNFNDSFRAQLRMADDKCGYGAYMRKYLVYPPAGQQPSATSPGGLPGVTDASGMTSPECDVFTMVIAAAAELNPCFSVYTITDLCPLQYDPLGFSGGSMFRPAGSPEVYFNREDVKRAINAPLDKTWEFCLANTSVFFNQTDGSLAAGPGSQPPLAKVIERTRNVILAHGTRDFVLVDDGTLLAIQNLSWAGAMGFQSRPSAALYIPPHDNANPETMAGSGVAGTVHSERGLTYLAVAASGHFVSEQAPALSFRSVEVLVGRREGFQSTAGFTIDGGGGNGTMMPPPMSAGEMGNGTVLMFPQSVMGPGGMMGGPAPPQRSSSGCVEQRTFKEQVMLAAAVSVLGVVLISL